MYWKGEWRDKEHDDQVYESKGVILIRSESFRSKWMEYGLIPINKMWEPRVLNTNKKIVHDEESSHGGKRLIVDGLNV